MVASVDKATQAVAARVRERDVFMRCLQRWGPDGFRAV
jgi:hypothetical protein